MELEVEYQKVKASWKSLKFDVVMDVCEFIIVKE
jgi:hypothetical protein